MTDKVLCRTHLKEALGDSNGDGLMLLIDPELKAKAEDIVKELNLKLKIEPCERFPVRFWILF